MSKGTTIKEALQRWEEKEKVRFEKEKELKENPPEGVKPPEPVPFVKAQEAKTVKLNGMIPPVEKMDASLSTLSMCEKLSLSTNNIEKIANLNGLKHLKILSLGRNNIKSLSGLEAVADTLVELWISYNFIEKLKGVGVLKKLVKLYISNNAVKDWAEFNKLAELASLEELNFVGNPLQESIVGGGEGGTKEWEGQVVKKLVKLKKLDGITLIRDEEGKDDEE